MQKHPTNNTKIPQKMLKTKKIITENKRMKSVFQVYSAYIRFFFFFFFLYCEDKANLFSVLLGNNYCILIKVFFLVNLILMFG